MRIKSGQGAARLHGISPEMVLAAVIANEVYKEHGAEMVITSGIDGKHSKGSLHYTGLALDFRTHSLPTNLRHKVRDELKACLGDDYDVVFEAEGEPYEHYHVEWQPKEPY